jgi:hypothetical protein
MDINTPIAEVISTMLLFGSSYFPFATEGRFSHMAEIETLVKKLSTAKVSKTDPISKAATKKFRRVDASTSLPELTVILEVVNYVVLERESEI